MKPDRSALAFLATLALAAGVVLWVIHRVDHDSAAGVAHPGWQQADTPPSGAVLGDPWLTLADAWTEAAIPLAEEIGPAVGPNGDVLAVADGIVVFSGLRGEAHAVILAHRNRDGNRFESIYAPLAEAFPRPGALIGRGMAVGRLAGDVLEAGRANYPEGIEQVDGGKSPLAESLESPKDDSWMSLEIGNAEKMLQLMAE